MLGTPNRNPQQTTLILKKGVLEIEIMSPGQQDQKNLLPICIDHRHRRINIMIHYDKNLGINRLIHTDLTAEETTTLHLIMLITVHTVISTLPKEVVIMIMTIISIITATTIHMVDIPHTTITTHTQILTEEEVLKRGQVWEEVLEDPHHLIM